MDDAVQFGFQAFTRINPRPDNAYFRWIYIHIEFFNNELVNIGTANILKSKRFVKQTKVISKYVP